MTIDKATKVLEEPDWLVTEYHTLEYDEAIQLGIEALKEVKKARYGDPALDGELLPSETEE